MVKGNPKSSIRLSGVCEDQKIDLDGYWYKLTDNSGDLSLFSKRPIKIHTDISGVPMIKGGEKILKLKSNLDPKQISDISL